MKFNRVLITGCGGMLGNAIYPYFKSRCSNVLATDKIVSEPWLQELNVCDTKKLNTVVDNFKPELILHLAAETNSIMTGATLWNHGKTETVYIACFYRR